MQVLNSAFPTGSRTTPFFTENRKKPVIKLTRPLGLATVVLPLLLAFFMLIAAPITAFAAQVTLAWDPGTTGTTESYSLFARLEGEQYDYQHPDWSGKARTATLNNLEDNASYYFVVRAVIGSAVSGDSNEVNHTTSVAASAPPTTTTDTSDDSGTTDTGNPVIDNVIIDNGGMGASPTGTWKISGGSDSYGGGSLYSKVVGSKYTYASNLTGRYKVAIWWSSYSSRCSSVPVKIYSGSTLLASVTINQRQNSGKWNVLGSYDFNGQARVVVAAQATNCSTCADAVEFTIVNDTTTADDATGTGGDTTGTSSNDTEPQDTAGTGSTSDKVAMKIIDTGDQGTSAAGSWMKSGGSDPYGGGSLYSKDVGASYTYTSALTGRYAVSLWWSDHNSRCSDVPVEIYDDNLLLNTISVNQRQNGGRWNTLGSYDFTGQAHVVVIASDSQCSTCADAVEFNINDVDHVTEVIDDGDLQTSSTGSWRNSGGTNPYDGRSLYSKDVGASYSFTSPLSGRYEVALWWSDYSSRCSDVPVEIYDDNRLLDTISVNQSSNGGRWNVLGSYDFTGQARVTVVAGDSSCSTCADAVLYSK